MDALLYALSKAGLARPVIDRTGLRGRYDINIDWSPEDILTDNQEQSGSNDSPPPSIFTALQEELGLKLEASKAQIEAVIVIHIERPSAN